MSFTTSDQVTQGLRTEKDLPDSWNLTTDAVAAKLHDFMVGKTGMGNPYHPAAGTACSANVLPVVITGVSRHGLGAEAARVICQHGAKMLILASRKVASIEEVIEDIKEQLCPGTKVFPIMMDLGSQRSVRAAAARVLELTPVVDVLINNAGVMMLPSFATTEEGIEAHLGINHIGHFLLTNLLMPALLRSPHGGRVANVSSAGAAGSPFRSGDYNFGDGKSYEPFLAYAQSKNANLLFSLELARRLGSRGLLAFGIDPGAVPDTQLSRQIPEEELVARGWFLKDGDRLVHNPAMPFITAAQGVSSYIMAAYDPDIKDRNGGTLLACSFLVDLPPHSTDPEAADKLWALSEELVGERFEY